MKHVLHVAVAFCVLLPLSVATSLADGPISIATPVPTAQPDLDFARLMGSWSCVTVAGSTVVKTFTTPTDGTVKMSESWHAKIGKAHGDFQQIFTRNHATKQWTTKSVGSGLVFTGDPSGMIGDTLDFTGVQTYQDRAVKTRERFLIDDVGRNFYHLWEVQKNHRWQPTSLAECTRT